MHATGQRKKSAWIPRTLLRVGVRERSEDKHRAQSISLKPHLEGLIGGHNATKESALLLSIVGIGPVTAALLLAELGEVSRFANVREVVAFVGLCPRLTCSGSSVHGPTPLSKRGSAVVRRALRFNPALKPFSQRLLARGKPRWSPWRL